MTLDNCVPPSVVWEETHCCVCGGCDHKTFLDATDTVHRRGTPFRIVRCKSCSHVYINPRPNLQSIDWFYPVDYGPHQELASPKIAVAIPLTVADGTSNVAVRSANVAGISRNSRFFRGAKGDNGNREQFIETKSSELGGKSWSIVRWATRKLGIRRAYRWLIDSASEVIPQLSIKSPRALEIGCGAGGFLDRLIERGWTVQGIEPADGPAQRCRDRGLQVSTGNFENSIVPENAFDVVFAWMVVEHIHEPESALRKIAAILHADGCFLFSVPNFGCWEPKLFGPYWFGIQLVHLNYFTIHELDTLLAKAGLRIEKVIYQHSVRSIIASIGIFSRERMGCESFGSWMIRYAGEMSMWSQLAFAPFARLLSWLGQAGRITVVAKRLV